MNIGDKILTLRKTKGLSQEQLASQLTVSRQSISKWELGEAIPDTENVLQLCKLFNVSADYLLNSEFESDMDIPAVKQSENRLKQHYKGLALRIIGITTSILGILGNLVLLVLSTMIEVPVTKTYIGQDGTTGYYGGGDVRGYEFFPFIEHYRLQALLGLFIVLLIGGIVFLLCLRHKYKADETL